MVMASPRLFSRLATATSRRQSLVRSARRIILAQQSRGIVGTAEDIKTWQEQLVLDDRELVNFNTLHEMQVNACDVYSTNKLFGTYAEASKSFEWMTFEGFADKVDQCRSVLQDLGESSKPCVRTFSLVVSICSFFSLLCVLRCLCSRCCGG